MATDSFNLGIPLPADSTKISEFPAVTRRGLERVAEVLAGGMTDAAQTAAATAALAAVTKELAAADVLTGTDPRAPMIHNVPAPASEPLVAAILDSLNRLTWLSARASDGGPTEWAMKHLTERLKYDMPDGYHSILFSVTDDAGRMSDLTVRASDGQFEDFVIDRLRSRLGVTGGGPGAGSGGAQFAAGDRHTRDGEVLPVLADTTRIAGWGSSSMQGIGPALAAKTPAGVTLYNGGKSGETSSQTAARLGSFPALVTVAGGTIPAAKTPVSVTVPNISASLYLKAYTGTLAGVPGTLAWSADVAGYTFTRTTAGSAVTVPAGTALIPTLGHSYRDAVTLLWMGKNDLFGAAGADQKVIETTDRTYDWMAPLVRRTLVIGHFVNGKTPATSAARNQILAVNAAHARRYGDLYLDVQDYLTGPQIWKDTGISPTAEDTAAQAIGNKPPSVSVDDGHLNDAGYAAVANLIITRLKRLGWY